MSVLGNKFGERGDKGDSGERFLINQLKEQYTVSDYRTDMQRQRNGIDFGITKSGWSREYTLDCKTNLYVEPKWFVFALEIQGNGKPGWFHTSAADRIYHVSSYAKTYMFYDLSEMRAYITKRLINNQTAGIQFVDGTNDQLLKIYVDRTVPNELPISSLFFEKKVY